MISILLPTRKRFLRLQKMVLSIKETAHTYPEIVVYIDEDDRESIEKVVELDVKAIVGPRLVFSDNWNKCHEKAIGDILMMGADDLIFRTPGWDLIVEEEFAKSADKIVLVYGDDLQIHVPSHPFIHQRWVEAVGYFSPPYFQYGGCDVWLHDIARFLGRKRFANFVIEHMHPETGKAAMDATYYDRVERQKKYDVIKQYGELAFKRIEDAAKLMDVIESNTNKVIV